MVYPNTVQDQWQSCTVGLARADTTGRL